MRNKGASQIRLIAS